MNLVAKLDSYPLNTQTMSFLVTITSCVVTSAVVTQNAFDPLQTKLVYIRDTLGLLIPLATFTQTPSCGYSATNTLLADTVPTTGFSSYPFLSFFNSTTIKVQAIDMTLRSKSFVLKQQTTIGSFTTDQTTGIVFVYCQDTTWNLNSVGDISTSVGA